MQFSNILNVLPSVRNHKSATALAAGVLATSLLLTASDASAALQNVEQGGVQLTFDNTTNLWWQPVMDRHGGNFVDANGSVADDNNDQYGGINTWQIASGAQMEDLFDNFDSLLDMCDPKQPDCFFEPTATVPCPQGLDCQGEYFTVWEGWSNTTEGSDDIRVGALINYKGINESSGWFEVINAIDEQDNVGGSWVVSDVAPIPVPAAVWLFGSGLLGLIGMARRKKV
jgi:hypothetical protein